MTCYNLMGLVLLWWKYGRVAETVDSGTQKLEEGRCSQDVLARIMVTKRGKAAHCTNECPFLFEISRDSVCELVFSLRSTRRFRKARLEAAHWVIRTSFEPQSVLYRFPGSTNLVPQLYTQDVPVALTMTTTTISTRHVRTFHVQGLRQASATRSLILLFWSPVRDWNCLEPFREASRPCLDPDSSRGVIARNTFHCLHLQHASST